MKLVRFPLCAGMILLLFLLIPAERAQASAGYQRTRDKKAIVWNTDQQPGDEADWSGGSDAQGYAIGSGTITWYKIDRTITGSYIPSEHGRTTVIASYSGTMVNGRFDGSVETTDKNGEKVHATFANGRRKTDWESGPASSTAGKKKKAARRTEETAAREPTATPAQLAKTERVAETKTTPKMESPAPADETDPARSLAAPPSSIRSEDPSESASPSPAPTATPAPSKASTPPASAAPHPANAADDAKAVAALDKQYQAAVKANDVAAMERILAEDFVLVNGRGKVSAKADLIKAVREKRMTYERQDEEEGTQKVHVWGDTAVVTALLSIKGTEDGNPVDYQLWFSSTYARVPGGWRCVFAQASRPSLKAEGAK